MLINQLDLKPRTRLALRRYGYEDTDDLANISEEQLLALPNFGRVSLDDLRVALRINNIPDLAIRPEIKCRHCGQPLDLTALRREA